MEQLTLLSEEHLAKISASPESAPEWPESVDHWPSRISIWLMRCHRAGLLGKTFPVSFPAMKEKTSRSSSTHWANSGMGGPTECWTLNTSEFPSAAGESCLSDILETGDLPLRYFLSQAACAGILRRADKRGRTLPVPLMRALTAVAERAQIPAQLHKPSQDALEGVAQTTSAHNAASTSLKSSVKPCHASGQKAPAAQRVTNTTT